MLDEDAGDGHRGGEVFVVTEEGGAVDAGKDVESLQLEVDVVEDEA